MAVDQCLSLVLSSTSLFSLMSFTLGAILGYLIKSSGSYEPEPQQSRSSSTENDEEYVLSDHEQLAKSFKDARKKVLLELATNKIIDDPHHFFSEDIAKDVVTYCRDIDDNSEAGSEEEYGEDEKNEGGDEQTTY